MRGIAGMLLVTLSGCLIPNPAYDGATGSTSRGEVGSTGGQATTSGAPTTSAGGEGSGSAGESTSGATTEPAATGEPTSGGSTGEAGSTGGPPPLECAMVTELLLDVVPQDTGVVPPTMGAPCPWGGGDDCAVLNFGRTHFYRLVNDEDAGKNAALIRFPVELVVQDIMDWGYAPEDLVGVRLEMVVWEPIAAPAENIDLEVALIAAEDADWVDGERDGAPALETDSNFDCKRLQGGCSEWLADGGPLASAETLGLLTVRPEDQPALDKDGSGSEYHMQVKSELLPAHKILGQIQKGLTPGFAVSLLSERDLDEGTIGIKLYEAPWDGPSVYVALCDEWR